MTRSLIAALLWAVSSATWASGLAWTVQGENGGTVYLVGTVHAANDSFYPLPAAINDAFAASEVLVMEVDPALLDGQAMAGVVAQLGLLPPGERLQDLVTADQWTRITQYASTAGMPPEVIDRFRPWFAATVVVVTRMAAAGFNPDLGMELHFHARAPKDMPLVALETPELQMRMLAGFSPEAQLLFLEDALTENLDQDLHAIIDAWRSGDEALFTALTIDEFDTAGANEEEYERIIVARNNAWIPPIEAMIADGRTHFVAVGSMHLVGPDSVVALLRARGYRVERLGGQTTIISKSSLPASQSGQRQLSGMSSQAVPGAMPDSG